MGLNLEEAKSISEMVRPFIEPIINTILKPHLKRLGDWIQRKDNENKIIDNFWENKFTRYLDTTYTNASYLTTLVFPNQQTKIYDLYVPLTIVSTKNYKRFKIENFDYSIFEKYGKLIISDTAGMGKSTLLKKITLSIIEQNKSIPILIELRKISNSNSIIDEIFNQIDPIFKSFDKELIFKFLELGSFTILLDGFDEIPFDLQEKVTIEVKEFIKKTSNNKFIITSRLEPALATFADFQSFYIQPLEENEAFLLINKLDNLSKVKYSQSLINEIKEKNHQVKEFLINPFLVSLLFKSYAYNKDIPSKKSTFYEEVYSCLFKHHDLSKEGFKRPKRSRLDILDFEIILRSIGFETAKLGKVIYSKDELIRHIVNSKKTNSNIDFKEQNYLEDLTTTVPLFSYEGDKIKWIHKSIQDFFAAKFISNHTRKEEIISKILSTNKYQYLNILELLYELEPKVFRKEIIKKILERFVEFRNTQFKESISITREKIEERISLCFGSKFCLIRFDTQIGFDKAGDIFALAADSKNFIIRNITLYNTEYYILSEMSLQKQIIKLLGLKKEDIFKDKINREFERIVLNQFEFNTPYIIDDNTNSPYNSFRNFGAINNKIYENIKDHHNDKAFLLDYNKCKELLKFINKEIMLDESKDLLSDL